jgi:hypothetical protein
MDREELIHPMLTVAYPSAQVAPRYLGHPIHLKVDDKGAGEDK